MRLSGPPSLMYNSLHSAHRYFICLMLLRFLAFEDAAKLVLLEEKLIRHFKLFI